MVTPVVVMPVAIVADPARAIIGPDHPAAVVRIIIRVVVIGPVEVPMKAVVSKREPAVAEAAAVENMSGAKSAAMEAAATVKTAATAASSTAMATTAADFGRRLGVCRYRRRARTDQRQRFRALVGCGRQHQHRGRRKAERTNKGTHQGADQPAPAIWNFHHA